MKTVFLLFLYLSLPLFIFWWGWFEWWVALPPTIFLMYLLSVFLRSLPNPLFTYPDRKEWTVLLACLLTAFLWTYLSGGGGFRPAHFDYVKHHLIFNNLVRYDWPVRYADGSYLCYYHAYYLPPSLLARWMGGLSSVHYYVFGWTWLGLTLLFSLLYRLNGLKFIGLFLFFNSPEVILLVYDAVRSPRLFPYLADLWHNDHTIELVRSPGGLLFHSHVDSFIATPQHALSAWMATAVFLKFWKTEPKSWHLPVLFALAAVLLYWSPLVAVGFLPLLIFFVFSKREAFLATFTPLKFIFFALLLSFPALIYYAGHFPLGAMNGWWFTFLKTPREFIFLGVFLGLEVGIWGVLLGYVQRKKVIPAQDFRLIQWSLLVLTGLALYRYGFNNDLARRASLPSLLVLCWGISQYSFRQPLLAIVLAFAVILPLKQHLRWLTAQPYSAIADRKITELSPYSIHYLAHYHSGPFDVVSQYLGKPDASYLRYFAPDIPPVPKQVTRAFYYWKSTFHLSDYEKQALRRYGIQRLYVKFFDVDWDRTTRRAVPKATIHFAENAPLEVVPTVFITNRTLENLSWGGVDELAGKIVEKLATLSSSIPREYQFDCDWSLTTRAKYFRLLAQIKKKLPVAAQLSATIRLHQIKYYRTTGVPPVAKGMLMYYNMDDWKNPKTQNSILDLAVAGRYADYVSDYPLPLDVVLPVFGWAVVYRNGKFLRFVNHLTHNQLRANGHFKKSTLANAYIALHNERIYGIQVRRGDLFRVEESTAVNLKISSQILAQEIQNTKVTFALYHLDSLNLSYYAVPSAKYTVPQRGAIQDSLHQIFQTFR